MLRFLDKLFDSGKLGWFFQFAGWILSLCLLIMDGNSIADVFFISLITGPIFGLLLMLLCIPVMFLLIPLASFIDWAFGIDQSEPLPLLEKSIDPGELAEVDIIEVRITIQCRDDSIY
jgi:hypothetical protein